VQDEPTHACMHGSMTVMTHAHVDVGSCAAAQQAQRKAERVPICTTLGSLEKSL
jgi:hypothetical protein